MIPDWLQQEIKSPCAASAEQARLRQSQLTKPPGSLGRLEALAVNLAAMQASTTPTVERVWVSVFAGDHGVCEEGISAFPQVVTQEMIKNFLHGGAAISVLAEYHQAKLEVVNTGTVGSVQHGQLIDHRIARGTQNFTQAPAMSLSQCYKALNIGAEAIQRAKTFAPHMVIGGEMGIGNSSCAAALAAALLNQPAEALVGPGTGLQGDKLLHKCRVVQKALDLHLSQGEANIFQLLARLGGFEILALAGFYLAAAQQGLPILIDGFISTAAALVSHAINEKSLDWMIFSHQSAEPGHQLMLQSLQAEPILNLNMRLGEGSGAAICLALIKQALALHNNMATFAQAEVSQ